MKKHCDGFWQNKNNVIEAARLCSTPTEFITKYNGAYLNARHNGWIDECYAHMNRTQVGNRHWDVKSNVIEAAKQCVTRSEFIERFHGAYEGARRNSWLDECRRHMQRPVPVVHWTKDRLQECADSCRTIKEFRERFNSAYVTACARGLVDDLFRKHKGKVRAKMVNGYWTKERTVEEALKYETRFEFQMGSRQAWEAAQRNGWLDDVCAHMEFVGSRYERAVYFIRSNIYKIGYIGLSMAPQKRYRQHLKTNHKNLRPLLQNPHELEILTAFMPKDEAAKLEVESIKKFKSEGWTLLNSKAGGGLGGSHLVWTKEATRAEAAKYETRGAFQVGSPSAYNAALKYHWLKEFFADHPNQGYSKKKLPDGWWTLERLKEIAKNFKYRDQMAKMSPGAHDAALNLGILNEIFSDHENKGYKKRGYEMIDYHFCDLIVHHCATRSEFKEKDPAAYKRARKQGWLDKLFGNHCFRGYVSKAMMKRHTPVPEGNICNSNGELLDEPANK